MGHTKHQLLRREVYLQISKNSKARFLWQHALGIAIDLWIQLHNKSNEDKINANIYLQLNRDQRENVEEYRENLVKDIIKNKTHVCSISFDKLKILLYGEIKRSLSEVILVCDQLKLLAQLDHKSTLNMLSEMTQILLLLIRWLSKCKTLNEIHTLHLSKLPKNLTINNM